MALNGSAPTTVAVGVGEGDVWQPVARITRNKENEMIFLIS
jgi:hypothetical protein